MAFNGDALRDLAAQFLALAEKQAATAPLLIAHRIMGISLLHTGDIAKARMHFDHAIALYDPAEHRPLATRFGQDAAVHALSYRSLALWLLGYPEAALVDADQAINDAREIGQAATLMTALINTGVTHIRCRNYAAANAQLDELVALADEKGALYWKVLRNGVARLPFCSDRQSLGRSPYAHLRNHRISFNGSNTVGAVVLITFGDGLCGTRSIR